MFFEKLSIENFDQKRTHNVYIFNPVGVNIVLGQKSPENDETNGVGKTALIETIRYCLGGSIPKDFREKVSLQRKSIFAVLSISHRNKRIRIARFLYDDSTTYVSSDDSRDIYMLNAWEIYTADDFRKYVEGIVFDAVPDEIFPVRPSFRAVSEYLIRDEKTGFADITLSQRNAIVNYQILSFLSMLPNNAESVLATQKTKIKNLQEELKVIIDIGKKVKIIREQHATTRAEIKVLQQQLDDADISSKITFDENRYALLKKQLEETRQNIHRLEYMKRQHDSNIESLQHNLEKVRDYINLESFYQELLGYFPQSIKRSYQEMSDFYDFMLQNRGDYFKEQIKKISSDLLLNQSKQEELLSLLTECTRIMKNSEIVSDLREISNQINEKYKKIAEYDYLLDMYAKKTHVEKAIETEKEILKQLTQKYKMHYEKYESNVSNIQSHFSKLIHIAYGEEGALKYSFEDSQKLSASVGRIHIDCSIIDEGAHGRYLMKINMFDVALLLNRIDSSAYLPFLIHDGSYSKPAPAVKGKTLIQINRYLLQKGIGQYFVTVNVEELLSEDLRLMKDDKMIVAELERDDSNAKRFMGIKY